jgi:hypothetical protein
LIGIAHYQSIPTSALETTDSAHLIESAFGAGPMRHFAKQFKSRARNGTKHPDHWIDELLTNKVHEILQIEGESAVLIRTALLGGLSTEQLLLLHKKHVCPLNFVYCGCSALHYSLHHSDMIFLSGPECSNSNTRCYAIMPHALWQRFRALESIESKLECAKTALEQIGIISFDELALVFLDAHLKSNLDFFLPQHLDSTSTYDAVQRAICSSIRRYSTNWEQHGVLLAFE